MLLLQHVREERCFFADINAVNTLAIHFTFPNLLLYILGVSTAWDSLCCRFSIYHCMGLRPISGNDCSASCLHVQENLTVCIGLELLVAANFCYLCQHLSLFLLFACSHAFTSSWLWHSLPSNVALDLVITHTLFCVARLHFTSIGLSRPKRYHTIHLNQFILFSN